VGLVDVVRVVPVPVAHVLGGAGEAGALKRRERKKGGAKRRCNGELAFVWRNNVDLHWAAADEAHVDSVEEGGRIRRWRRQVRRELRGAGWCARSWARG